MNKIEEEIEKINKKIEKIKKDFEWIYGSQERIEDGLIAYMREKAEYDAELNDKYQDLIMHMLFTSEMERKNYMHIIMKNLGLDEKDFLPKKDDNGDDGVDVRGS